MSLPFYFYFYFDINYLNIFRRGCENIFWKSNSCELLVRLDTGDLGDGRLYCLSTVSFESHFSVILRLRLWSDHLNKNILDKLRIHITPPSYVLHHTHTHTHPCPPYDSNALIFCQQHTPWRLSIHQINAILCPWNTDDFINTSSTQSYIIQTTCFGFKMPLSTQ